MTQTQFLQSFNKHLRVAEPKRSDIIAETTTHFHEGQNLGEPRSLASQLNRVHIGWGSSPWTPVALLVLWVTAESILDAVIRNYGISASSLTTSRFHVAIWTINNFVWFLGPIAGSIFVGVRMSRLYRPWQYFSLILGVIFVMTFFLSARAMLNEPGTDQMWVMWLAGFEIGLVMAIVFAAGAMLTMVTVLPRQSVSQRRQRFGVWFEILLTLGLLVIGYFIIMILSESIFQPYDTWLTEMRPRGSWVVAVNNFFETGWGTPLLMLGYSFWIGRRAWRNIRRLRIPS